MPRKEIVGKVVSDKMDKTVVVAVESYIPHPKYEKQMVHTKKFHAHDEQNRCKTGDVVRIRECRPLSKSKRWLVVDVTGHGEDTTILSEESLA
jgi:small subunit ribosomal protein S17